MRARIGALLIGLIVVAACSSSSATPSAPGATTTPGSSPSPAASATPTGAPSASPEPSVAGPWYDAGTLTVGRRSTHALVLDGGTVLVVGSDDLGCVRDDSVAADLWDPGASTWSAAAPLNKPRGWFAAVALADGRALVAGGMNQGTSTIPGYQDGHAAYSSAYIFDPVSAESGWARVGLLSNARVGPGAATLLDGRVIVAGGLYSSGPSASRGGDAGDITLARFVPAAGPSGDVRLANIDPGPYLPALATAELYDPARDTWSATGPLRFARIDPLAVTLADGRVLVVGSRQSRDLYIYGWTKVDDRAVESAEVYDPAKGRFALAGTIPVGDWSPLASLGSGGGLDPWQPLIDPGTLVALPDGGALLVGRTYGAYTGDGAHEGRLVRTLRFDATTSAWTEIDRWLVAHTTTGDPPDPWQELVAGHVREAALAATLTDGRVLVAGGIDPLTTDVSDAAVLFDPATGEWAPVPAMPTPRAWGEAVALSDGSALLVGGRSNTDEPSHCGKGEAGLATTLRFVPSR